MATSLTAIRYESPISKSIFLDILAIAFIYFLPALSHFANFPIYLVEPMRMMMILVLAHTTRRNTYIIAFTLPLFSFIIATHPVFYKAIIMTAELVVNIWLFYFLARKLRSYFAAMMFSILISKVLYYALKFGLLNLQLLEGNLISTPIYVQVITATIFSFYLFSILSRRELPPAFVDPTKEEF